MKIVKLLRMGALLAAAIAFVGCEMTLNDEDSRKEVVEAKAKANADKGSGNGNGGGSGTDSSLPVIYVGLGGENTFNLTSVKVGDKEQTIKNPTLAPSTWNAISEFETVKVQKGFSASFTFTQAQAGSSAWNTWALAVYDNATVAEAKGNFVRGDNWLNKSVDAGFKAGLWSEGEATAGGAYSNEYTYETAGKALTSSDTVVIKVEYTDSGVKITETINEKLAYTAEGAFTSSTPAPTTDNSSQGENTGTNNSGNNGNNNSGNTENNNNSGNSGNGQGGESGTGTTVTVENLTSARTFSATETAGYTVKLGCDNSSMKVTSVKYNDSELMPANTAYTLTNLSFNGVNVGSLSADTWTVEYTYSMTAVGSSAWTDYNFEIADGNTTDGALGYWSLRYDNYAVGYLKGYHEYGKWDKDHVDGVASDAPAYGGHWYGMTNNLGELNHSQSLNKTLVMKVQKTADAFVITIKSDGTEVWKCVNEKVSQ